MRFRSSAIIVTSFLCASSCLLDTSAGAELIFSASFDKGLNADTASGSGAAQSRGDVKLVPGKSGQAVRLGRKGVSLFYPKDGNVSLQKGSVAMWIKPVGFSPS